MISRALAIALVLAAPSRAVASTAAPADDAALRMRVTTAIEQFVTERMGEDARVIVDQLNILSLRSAGDADLRAVALAGARLGARVQFALLTSRPERGVSQVAEVGRAVAYVTVCVPHLSARRLLERGAAVSSSDVTESDDEVRGVEIRRLPRAADLRGARISTHIAEGETLTATSLLVPPAVRAGQRVRAIVRVGDAVASATLVAEQSGVTGAVVRVVNPASGKALRARVIGEDVVEVIQ